MAGRPAFISKVDIPVVRQADISIVIKYRIDNGRIDNIIVEEIGKRVIFLSSILIY